MCATLSQTMTSREIHPEIPICAAWQTEEGPVIRGHRHPHCRDAAISMGLHPRRESDAQGFMTSRNRFVSREEAARLFRLAGLRSAVTYQVLPHDVHALFSEDLY